MKLTNILLAGLLISGVYADEFDDEFDSEFTDIKTPKKDYTITFNGELKIRGYTFIEDKDYNDKNNARTQGDMLLELNSKYKKDNYIVSGSVFSLIGTEYNTYAYDKVLTEFRDTNKEVPIAGIKEFYMINTHDNYDITIGKKVFKAGISTLYSPSDVYNIKLSPDPMDPYTIGTWLADFEYYNEDSSYGIVFFPFISDSKTFSDKSRWSATNDNQQTLYDFRLSDNAEVIDDKTNAIRVLLKYKTTQILFDRGVDFILNWGYGPSLYNILEYTNTPNKYLKTKPKVWYVSTGFSTTYDKLEIHGEGYYQHSIGNLDDDFVSLVGGATYTLDKFVDKVGFDKIDMTMEYVREIVTNKFDNPNTYKSSKDERAPKNDILIKVDAQINHKWSLNYFGNFRLELDQNKDSGRYQKIGTTYTIKDGLVSELFVEVFNGDVNSYYGKWQDNDRIVYQIKYSF